MLMSGIRGIHWSEFLHFFFYKTLLVSLSVFFWGRCSNPACTDLPTVTIEVDVKNIQYTEDEAELAVTCEVEASPEAKVR